VDTHVGRLARRLRLTREEDPAKVERDLAALYPPARWTRLSHQLIAHGRGVCAARSPRCADCALAPRCPSAKPATPRPGAGGRKKPARRKSARAKSERSA